MGIYIDPELHHKLKYLAAYEGRSVNGEILYLARCEIEVFEKEHGKSSCRKIQKDKSIEEPPEHFLQC